MSHSIALTTPNSFLLTNNILSYDCPTFYPTSGLRLDSFFFLTIINNVIGLYLSFLCRYRFSLLYLKVEFATSHVSPVSSFLIRMMILAVVLIFDKKCSCEGQVDFQLKILLLQPANCWNHGPPYQAVCSSGGSLVTPLVFVN